MSSLVHLLGCCMFFTWAGADLNTPPPCLESVASACFSNALSSAQPSGCNWNIIMPLLQDCVVTATSGCNIDISNQWLTMLTQVNSTFNSPLCSPTCPDPQTSYSNMQACFTVTDTSSGGTYALNQIIADIIANNNPMCTLLQQAIACLTSATNGCSALMDITYKQLQSMNVSQATAICNVNNFNGPTTSAPLPILQTVTSPTAAVAAVSGDSGVQLSTGWIVLIALSGALFLIIVIFIICFARSTIRNTRERRELLLADRPSESNVVTRSGWRLLSTQNIVNSKPAVNWPVRPSETSYQPIYRRNFIN